jgi:hypothetical protein
MIIWSSLVTDTRGQDCSDCSSSLFHTLSAFRAHLSFITNTESGPGVESTGNFLWIRAEWQQTKLLRIRGTNFESRRLFTYAGAHTSCRYNELRCVFPRGLPKLEWSHSPLFCSKLYSMWIFTSTLPPRRHSSELKHRRNFTFMVWHKMNIGWETNMCLHWTENYWHVVFQSLKV